jgi:hypothetical protein
LKFLAFEFTLLGGLLSLLLSPHRFAGNHVLQTGLPPEALVNRNLTIDQREDGVVLTKTDVSCPAYIVVPR